MPLVYVFEEARGILIDQTVNVGNIYYAFMLNIIYLSVSITYFIILLIKLEKKTLTNVGE